ncbi:MAG: GntR family transcriptional regulator [Defluviitaleaceae bacterium]|nr:GntR family transcriptional regulator [Defluviitaleaceae bacterium]
MLIYKEIALSLENKIVDGTYPKGYMLPGENELCEMFNASRMTVRKALEELSKRGVIYKVKGKGTFVSKFEIYKEYTLKGFSQIMTEKGVNFRTVVRKFEIVEADLGVSENLRVPIGSNVYNLERVRYIFEKPVGIESVYLKCDAFPNFLSYDFSKDSLYKILERNYGISLSRVEQKIFTIDITGVDAKLLFNKNKATALYIEGIAYDKNTHPIEYERDIFNGNNYHVDVIIQ